MSNYVTSEIASQPNCWRRALDLVAAAPAALAELPVKGERVAVIGCGTSLFMAQAYAGLRELSGHGETDAWPASEFTGLRGYDRVLALTRSGTTTELVAAIARTPANVPTTAIVADADTPAATTAKHAVVLDFADEQSVVQTRFPTTLLILLRAHLGEDVTALPARAELATVAPLPASARTARQVTFLGTGWSVGIANEAALKAREAAQVWTESYPAMEYRHGPIAVADAASLVWLFGTVPTGLVDEVARTGAAVEVSTEDPLVDLVRAQRMAVELAAARGLDPDRPRNLARSIILA